MNLGIVSPGRVAFDDLLVTGATWLLGGAGAWLAVLFAAVLAEALTQGRWQPARWTGAPLSWRRALLAAILATLAALGVSPAHADSAGRAPTATAVEGLPLPARPSGDVSPAREGGWVVVAPGDSLWALARGAAPAADDRALAALVERIHQLNRDVIGPDPDEIHPGQRLVLPGPDNPVQEPL